MSTAPLQYVRHSLAPDEELIHVGEFHWIYTFSAIMKIVWGIFWAIVIVFAAYYIETAMMGKVYDGFFDAVRGQHAGVKILSFLSVVLGMFMFAHMMVHKATTEIAVTTSRLIYKRGLIARYVGEMAIDRIEGVNFLQGILGRILNYGRVVVRGMGVGEMVLPPIADPILFRKAIEKAKGA